MVCYLVVGHGLFVIEIEDRGVRRMGREEEKNAGWKGDTTFELSEKLMERGKGREGGTAASRRGVQVDQ